MAHTSVLLHELVDGVAVAPGSIVLDATVGLAGHSELACSRLTATGTLIGLDRDRDALAQARERLSTAPCRVELVEEDYRHLDLVLDRLGITRINAAMFDLGMNSEQLELSGRGFSFQKDEPLLMTFTANPDEEQLTAREIVNTWDEEHIADIIYGYGEERFARRIAAAIVAYRATKPIETTMQLVEILKAAIPVWSRHRGIHFATRTFQALRITVNDEIEGLREGLAKALDRLSPNGRVGVISFHSIEDRVVKRFFADRNREGAGTTLTKKPITATEREVSENPRARSAKLRIFEKN
jgi:16S rRNA (cytosine1402-N4)-methyltransferase